MIGDGVSRKMSATASMKITSSWPGGFDGDAATYCEQRQVVILYRRLFLSATECTQAVLTLSSRQMNRRDRFQNEAMGIIAGFPRDMAVAAIRYMLDMPTRDSRGQIYHVSV